MERRIYFKPAYAHWINQWKLRIKQSYDVSSQSKLRSDYSASAICFAALMCKTLFTLLFYQFLFLGMNRFWTSFTFYLSTSRRVGGDKFSNNTMPESDLTSLVGKKKKQLLNYKTIIAKIWFYQTSWLRLKYHRERVRKLTFFVRANRGIVGCCGLYESVEELCHWWKYGHMN